MSYYVPPPPDLDDMSEEQARKLWKQFKIFIVVLVITGIFVLTLSIIKSL